MAFDWPFQGREETNRCCVFLSCLSYNVSAANHLMFVFLQQDFTPEKKSGGRGVKKAGGRGKKKVNQKAPSQKELPVTKLGVFSLRFQLSLLFLCDLAEGFVRLWFRLWIGIREESSRQRLGGREASTGSVWFRIPVWLKVWIGIRSSPAEGPTGSQERCEFSFALLFTTVSSTIVAMQIDV